MTFIELKEQIEKNISKLSGVVALSVKFINTNQSLEINSKQQLWAASIIKIPIACEFFRLVKNDQIDENTRIKVTNENLVEGAGVIKLLDRDDKFTLLDLVKLMLAVSDNSATNQVVDLIGWENVEKYMKQLGLKNTAYRHKMMIKAGRGPNLTTAEDILALFEKLNNKELPHSEKIIEILKQQQDRTRIPLLLPDEVEVAHKPGSLPEAMHDAGIIYSENPFIFVFLSDDQKDKRLTNGVLSECAKLCYDYSVNFTCCHNHCNI